MPTTAEARRGASPIFRTLVAIEDLALDIEGPWADALILLDATLEPPERTALAAVHGVLREKAGALMRTTSAGFARHSGGGRA